METRDCLPEPDRWGNVIPPTRPEQYTGETPSSVMRYDRGRVTQADEYYWARLGGPRTQGRIWPLQGAFVPMIYKEQTVFSCNPFLPIVVANGDTSLPTDDPGDDRGGPDWNLLHFRHDMDAHPGVSLATCSRSNRLRVAGRDPSWIPHLVPQGFANPHSHQSSQGLGGDLPLLLALMAFSEPRHLHDSPEVDQEIRMSRTFYGSGAHWRDNYWTWNSPPQGCKLLSLVHLLPLSLYRPSDEFAEIS